MTRPARIGRSLPYPRWMACAYLWQWPVFVIMQADRIRQWSQILIDIPLSIAFTSASYRLVEQPILRLRKRVVGSGASRPRTCQRVILSIP